MPHIKAVKNSDGTVQFKLKVANAEHLWHLYNLITPGDSITTVSRRKVQREDAVSHLGKSVKVLKLEILITNVTFSPDELRINGTNKSESEFIRLGAYHALTVSYDPPQEVLLRKKEWNEVLEERLADFCQEDHATTALILMNYGDAQLALLYSSMIHIKTCVQKVIAKKRQGDGQAREKSILKFFNAVKEAMIPFADSEEIKSVVLASPGDVRNQFFSYLKASTQHDNPIERSLAAFLRKFSLIKVHNLSHDAVWQAFSDPQVSSTVQATRCQSEVREWDRFQTMLSQHPDRCAYTPQVVLQAVYLGAVSSLMICDQVFRSPDPIVRHFFLAMVQSVKRLGGAKVSIFSSIHVTGEQLSLMGDVAAILSYDCPELNDIIPAENFFACQEVTEFLQSEKVTKVVL